MPFQDAQDLKESVAGKIVPGETIANFPPTAPGDLRQRDRKTLLIWPAMLGKLARSQWKYSRFKCLKSRAVIGDRDAKGQENAADCEVCPIHDLSPNLGPMASECKKLANTYKPLYAPRLSIGKALLSGLSRPWSRMVEGPCHTGSQAKSMVVRDTA